MKDKEKTEKILKALQHHFTSWGRCNVLFPELRLGSGYSDISQRRIDLFMISAEKGNYTTAFEIKVSRGDFLKDIKDNLKQRGARLYATNFFYVAPEGLIKPEEVPVWAGLMEYNFEDQRFRTKVPAPLTSRNTPSWGLVCSLVRRVNEKIYRDKNNDLENIILNYERELKKALCILKKLANKDFVTDKDEEIMLAEYKYKNFVFMNDF